MQVNTREEMNAVRESGATPYSRATTFPAAICAEREIHENDFARDDVQAEVGVDGDEHHARHERRKHELQHCVDSSWCVSGRSCVWLKASASERTIVPIKSRNVLTPGAPPTFDGTMTALAPVRSHLTNLVVVEVSRREQHAHVPLLHEVDQLADMLRCGRNTGLGSM